MHLIPVTTAPIFYFLRSSATRLKDVGGFKVTRVACPTVIEPSRILYFYENRKGNIWVAKPFRDRVIHASMVKSVNTTDLKSVG